MKDHARVKHEFFGFARLYLAHCHGCSQRGTCCHTTSKSRDQIDIQIYSKLVELDSKLGTIGSEQLYWCLHYKAPADSIKVWILLRNKA